MDIKDVVHAVPATAITPLRTTLTLVQMQEMLMQCIAAGRFPNSSDGDAEEADFEVDAADRAADEADAKAAAAAAVEAAQDTRFLQMLAMDHHAAGEHGDLHAAGHSDAGTRVDH